MIDYSVLLKFTCKSRVRFCSLDLQTLHNHFDFSSLVEKSHSLDSFLSWNLTLRRWTDIRAPVWTPDMASMSTDRSIASLTLELYGKSEIKHYARMLRRDLICARDILTYTDSCNISRRTITYDPAMVSRVRQRLATFDDLAASVFGTYEIVEMILLHTWTTTMVAMQRVSKTFNTIITTSRSIRRALFLEPPAGPCEPVVNRMFANNPRKLQLGPWRMLYHRPHVHPERPGHELVLHCELDDDFCSRAKPLDDISRGVRMQAWRNMVFSQPLCDRVQIKLQRKKGRLLIQTLDFDRGDVTMGEAQDSLREAFNATVASEDWRDYVDYRETFKKNIDGGS